jgi:hypothetical protein
LALASPLNGFRCSDGHSPKSLSKRRTKNQKFPQCNGFVKKARCYLRKSRCIKSPTLLKRQLKRNGTL